MSRICLNLILALTLSVPLFGAKSLNGTSITLDKQLIVRGRVVDAETKATIEFANILLYSHPDTIPLHRLHRPTRKVNSILRIFSLATIRSMFPLSDLQVLRRSLLI